jgi:hypothetical protein
MRFDLLFLNCSSRIFWLLMCSNCVYSFSINLS